MKRVLGIILVLIGVAVPAVLFAQVVAPLTTERSARESYPVSAHEMLWKQEEEVNRFAIAHPEVLARARLRKSAAWGFTVNSTQTWYADNLPLGTRYGVPSTCRAVGTHCYVFVEDAQWGVGVTQAIVDSVTNAFDNATPANSAKGIYQTDVDAFGNPPDIDLDPKIIILILDIKDGFTGSGGYIAGYFYSFNEIPKSSPGYETSNEAEIYFLDCNPLNLTTSGGIRTGMSTTAHEFQHMIHWNYNKLDDTFTNEGCSLIAEVNAGYPIFSPTLYANEPNHYLFDWRRTDYTLVLNDYSRAARFFLYFKEQFGMGIFKSIVSTNQTGIPRLDAALASTVPATSRRFADIFQDWLVANILNDKAVDPKWGYTYPALSKVVPKVFISPNVSPTTEAIAQLGAQYYSFRNGTSLSTTFATLAPPSSFWIRAVESGPAGKRVLPVTLGVPFSEPSFGTGYTDVTFVVGDVDPLGPYNITYSSTGSSVTATELKWDVTEPSGYFSTSLAGDTVCVTFDGVPGARLDSVRVALRRTGSMSGGIWRHTGQVRPTPLGTPLAVPITVSGKTTPGVPYPVPWPNWGSADVHAQNVDASQPFAVALVCTGAGTVDNRVMVTTFPSTGPYHSYTYSNGSASGPNWYYFTANTAGDTVYLYLVRAYVSIPTAAGEETRELLPSVTLLHQNYPNPFNPNSDIRYQISELRHVRLSVFDMLGREVAILVNEDQSPGTYNVRFSGEGLASGVYFYRLLAGSFAESRRMILLK